MLYLSIEDSSSELRTKVTGSLSLVSMLMVLVAAVVAVMVITLSLTHKLQHLPHYGLQGSA